MPDAKIFKFDVGSSTDQLLNDIAKQYNVNTDVDAIQNSLA